MSLPNCTTIRVGKRSQRLSKNSRNVSGIRIDKPDEPVRNDPVNQQILRGVVSHRASVAVVFLCPVEHGL